MAHTSYFVYQTPMGRMTLCGTSDALTEAHFGAVECAYEHKASALTNQAATELQEYLAGKRTQFSVPLQLAGTEFQQQVWSAIQDIEYGKTATYADIAETIGNPQAFRAVGMAANRNPLPIFVPCHRVIATDGTLGGYAGGTKIKEFLVNLERTHS